LGLGTLTKRGPCGFSHLPEVAAHTITEVHLQGMWLTYVQEEHNDISGLTAAEFQVVFEEYMEAVCAEKQFTKFWWGVMSKWGLQYLIFQEAVRTADAYAIEVIWRASLALLKYTHKHKYVQLQCHQLAEILTSSPKDVELIRCQRTASLGGRLKCNVGLDVPCEKQNYDVKDKTDRDCSDKWLRTISGVYSDLTESHDATRKDFEVSKRLHFSASVEQDEGHI
jgi:hypothetical protein